MDFEKTIVDIRMKQQLFASTDYLSAVATHMAMFIPSEVNGRVADKAYDALRTVYLQTKAYEHQTVVLNKVKDIEVSHILGCNSVVVPIIVTEYAELRKAIRNLDPCYEKLKQWGPAYELASSIKKALKVDLGLLLKNDLETYSKLYSIDIDLTSMMDLFKKGG